MSQSLTSYEPYAPPRQPRPDTPWRPSDAVEPAGDTKVESDCRHHLQNRGGPNCLVIASVVCVVIWAMSGGGYFWPVWVLLPTVLPLVLRMRRFGR